MSKKSSRKTTATTSVNWRWFKGKVSFCQVYSSSVHVAFQIYGYELDGKGNKKKSNYQYWPQQEKKTYFIMTKGFDSNTGKALSAPENAMSFLMAAALAKHEIRVRAYADMQGNLLIYESVHVPVILVDTTFVVEPKSSDQ